MQRDMTRIDSSTLHLTSRGWRAFEGISRQMHNEVNTFPDLPIPAIKLCY
jgi:hypothetical protein